MYRYIIGSLWDRNNRNGANKNFEYLFEGRQKIDELNHRADNILSLAEKANNMNVDVQQQIDELIIHSGTSDAEVIQARNGYPLLKDRLNDIEINQTSMNVLYYGAVGDGFEDDSDAFQRALDNGNKTIFIPEGKTLRITKTLNMFSNTKIIGKGEIFHDTDETLLFGDGLTNVSVKLNVNGRGATEDYILNKNVIYFKDSNHITVRGNNIKENNGVHTIVLRRCTDFNISGNSINRYSYGGISLLDGCLNGYVDKNRITNNTNRTSANAYPIMLSGYDSSSPALPRYAENIQCDSNFIDNEIAWWEGIDSHGGKKIKITNNIVLGSMVGIALVSGPNGMGIFDSIISNNICIGKLEGITRATSSVGITLSPVGGKNNTVSDNIIANFGHLTTTESDIGGIKIQNGSGINVANNLIENCVRYGINSRVSLRDINIYGNTIKNLKPHSIDSDTVAVWFENSVEEYRDVYVSNNIFIDEDQYAQGFGIGGPSSSVMDPEKFTYIKEFNNANNMANYSKRTTFILSDKGNEEPSLSPTRVGKKNDIIYNTSIGPGDPLGWICTESHVGNASEYRAKWRPIGGALNVSDTNEVIDPAVGTMIYNKQIGKPMWWNGTEWFGHKEFSYEYGTTRPSDPSVGEMYFDLLLKQPIWYSNTATWVNANGDEV